MMKLSDYVISFVADLGVKHVFLVTGGGAMHLNDSLVAVQRDRVRLQLCTSRPAPSPPRPTRKATNHLGVALVTTGPGRDQRRHGSRRRLARFDAVPLRFGPGEARRPDVRRRRQPAGHAAARRSGNRHRLDRQTDHQVRRHGSRPEPPSAITWKRRSYLACSGRPGPGLDRHSARRAGVSRRPRHARQASIPPSRRPRRGDADLDRRSPASSPRSTDRHGPWCSPATASGWRAPRREFAELLDVLNVPVVDDVVRR